MQKQEEVYRKLAGEIVRRLQSSVYSLPTEREMCGSLGVSRQTLRRALSVLKEKHILISRQGSGYVLTGLYPDRANQIVVLAESDEVYLYPRFLSKITGFFDRLHYQVSVILTGGETQTEREVLQDLLADPPRGLIACVRRSLLPSCNAYLYDSLSGAGTKIVFPFGRYPNVQAGKTSLPDNEQGGYLLTEYLLRQGRTAAAMILIEGDVSGQERYLGYCRAKTAFRLPLHDSCILRIPPEEIDRIRLDHSDTIITEYLGKLPEDTDAVICQQDELAFTVIRAYEKQGISVPGRIRVAGFDNSHLRTAGSISLTTMQRGFSDEADAACQAMMQLLTSIPENQAPDTWKLVKGGSA